MTSEGSHNPASGPVRVVHVIAACASGGVEVFVKDLALEMQRLGHPQAVAYLSEATRLGCARDFEEQYLAELHGGGVTGFEIGHAARRNPVFGAFRLHKIIRQFRADLLHVHLGRAILSRALLTRRIPTVFTYHSSVAAGFDARFFRLFDRFVDRYIVICSRAEQFLAGVSSRTRHRIYNGIHPDRIQFRGLRRRMGRLRILSVGNLRPEKNYETIIQVAASLRERLEELDVPVFRIAGEGEGRQRLERLIAEHQLGDVVHLLGARKDIDKLMGESDVLVNTSSFEGLPISLLEAARSGLPLIATDVGGVGEVVLEGENGFLVPFDRPDQIVERILYLMQDEGALGKLSAGARRLSSRFLLGQSVKEHLNVYASLLAESGPSVAEANADYRGEFPSERRPTAHQ